MKLTYIRLYADEEGESHFERECLLGEIVAGRMIGNAAAVLVQNAWDGLPERYPLVEQDAFVIMPNHVHGILSLTGAAHDPQRKGAASRTQKGVRPVLRQVIRAFKSISAIAANRHLVRSG